MFCRDRHASRRGALNVRLARAAPLVNVWFAARPRVCLRQPSAIDPEHFQPRAPLKCARFEGDFPAMSCRMLHTAFAVLWLLIGGSATLAQEWTRFRGPNGTGISPAAALPSAWTEADYAWRVELPGQGHSSPVLWGDQVFLTSAVDDGAERLVMSLRASDGAAQWLKHFPGAAHPKHQLNSFASPTPAVDAEHVYVSWSSPESYLLLALTHAGHEVWRVDLGPFVSQHSAGPSPIVHGDLVILGNDQDGDSFLLAVDRGTGQERWRTPRRTDRVAYSTPCLYERPGSKPELIFLSGAHGTSGIDPHTGHTLWELPVFDKRTVSSPVCGAGLIFGTCGSGAGGNYVAAVRPGAAGGVPAELAFKLEKAAPYVPTPVVVDNRLFLWGDAGVVTCVELPSGSVIWQRRVGGNFFGSPVWVAGKLYCQSSDGDVAVIAAADEYALLGKSPLGELSHSTPAVAGGRMFLRSVSHLAALDPAKP